MDVGRMELGAWLRRPSVVYNAVAVAGLRPSPNSKRSAAECRELSARAVDITLASQWSSDISDGVLRAAAACVTVARGGELRAATFNHAGSKLPPTESLDTSLCNKHYTHTKLFHQYILVCIKYILLQTWNAIKTFIMAYITYTVHIGLRERCGMRVSW